MLDGGADPAIWPRRLVPHGLGETSVWPTGAALEDTNRAGAWVLRNWRLERSSTVVLLPVQRWATTPGNAARAFVGKDASRPVPVHLRNAPTSEGTGVGKTDATPTTRPSLRRRGKLLSRWPAGHLLVPTQRPGAGRRDRESSPIRELDRKAKKVMDLVPTLALSSGLAWASWPAALPGGFLAGLLANLGYHLHLPPTPAILQNRCRRRGGVLALAELVADKGAGLRFPLWDGFQTFVCIPAGRRRRLRPGRPIPPGCWRLIGGTITAGTHFASAGSRWPSTPRRNLLRWLASFGEEGWCSAASGHAGSPPVWFRFARPFPRACWPHRLSALETSWGAASVAYNSGLTGVPRGPVSAPNPPPTFIAAAGSSCSTSTTRSSLDAVVAGLASGKPIDFTEFKTLEAERKTLQTRTQELQAQRNALSKQIGMLKGQGRMPPGSWPRSAPWATNSKTSEGRLAELLESSRRPRHAAQPARSFVAGGGDDSANVEIKRWGRLLRFFPSGTTRCQRGPRPARFTATAARFPAPVFRLLKAASPACTARRPVHARCAPPGTATEVYALSGECRQPLRHRPACKFEEDAFKVLRRRRSALPHPTAEVPVTNVVRDEIHWPPRRLP